jgi:tetratricopeptide (TPR) repeat protein
MRGLERSLLMCGLMVAFCSLALTGLAVSNEVLWRLAKEAFTRGDPTRALAYLNLPRLRDYRFDQRTGQIYLAQGDIEAATKAYQKAVELNPLKATLYYDLGWLLLHQQQTAEAETVFTKALRLELTNPHYLYALGVVKERQGLSREALAFYQQALSFRELPKVRARLERLLNHDPHL